MSFTHFVESHRRVIALLDAARDLGLTVAVRDDSGYWADRNEQKLVEAVERWNSRVARIAGRFADAFEQPGLRESGLKADAPIFQHRDFERLEAQE